ncbi:Mbeg1-like protein [Clostridium sp. KNHs205]|jgi:hypothetical protein|uniref:Mbeg1-like protein n=1 Tax=Clostridium sp. KNHs205 TaxID=1449050 RepID=UPI00051C7B4D|nr:Mbeg1-like protein [Clostridium sp. KNHs205]
MGYTDKELRDATQIAYMDLNEGYKELVRLRVKPPYTIKQIINNTINLKKRAQLENKIKEGDISIDLDSWKITQIHDTNKDNGFYGCIIETSENEAIVAFRGSESTTDAQFEYDWINADIGLLNNNRTPQQAEVDVFLSAIKDNGYLDKYTYVASTGHSLGGNLSDYFTIKAANDFSDKIKQSVNFDGPGFSKEFLEDNKKEINVMSEIMKHYQWSAVGNLLFPVPGVEFVTTDIKNYSDTSTYLQNDFDKEYLYNLICRHDTRSLKYDEHGNLVNGKMDNLAWFMGKISKLIDRMPSAIGNSLKDSLTYFLLHGEEIKSLFVDDKGLTTLGKSLVAAAAVAVLLNPIGTIAIAAKVIVTAAAVVLAAVGLESLIEFIESTVEKVGELVSNAVKMAAKKFAEFKDFLKKEVSKIKDLAKYAITLLTNKAARDKLVNEVAGKIRDYSAGILEELKKAYSLIISEEFFDMRIWNKKYLQEKWYGRLLLSPIQAVAFSLAGSFLDAGIGFINKVTGVFEEVQELDDSFAKFLNTKADELNAVADLLD